MKNLNPNDSPGGISAAHGSPLEPQLDSGTAARRFAGRFRATIQRVPKTREAAGAEDPIVLLAPSLRRAQLASRVLGGRWEGKRLANDSSHTVLARSTLPAILLCPAGKKLGSDLEFLREARERFLWPAPDGDLRAAIAGLRGEDSLPLKKPPQAPDSDRKSALLFEGIVTFQRAQAALRSQLRQWIVENPLRVRLTERQLQKLAQEGVRWSTLEPTRVLALLASPELARAQDRWRRLLPPRVKVKVLRR